MTTSTQSASVNITEQADPIAVRRQAAIFLIIEFLLIFAPLVILGAAINWPGSLDEPASVNLPLILEQYMARHNLPWGFRKNSYQDIFIFL